MELKANVCLPYVPRVCRLPGALTQLGFVWKTSSGCMGCVLPQEKGKQVTRFPAKSSRWAQPQARMMDGVQAHTKGVWQGSIHIPTNSSCLSHKGEGVRASFQKSFTSASLQIQKNKASFPSGRASLKHFLSLELSSQDLFLGYFPLLNYLIRSLCNWPGLEILLHSLHLQSQRIARVSKTWNCVTCNSNQSSSQIFKSKKFNRLSC